MLQPTRRMKTGTVGLCCQGCFLLLCIFLPQWRTVLSKSHNDEMTLKVQCDWPFAVMLWLEMLKLSSPSTCLSVVLNLDVNKKKNRARFGEDLYLIVTILPEMDVGVSKSHVFLNYSPRALFSQWDTHLHGAAVCSPVLRGSNILHCWLTSSAFCFCVWVVVLAVWRKKASESIGCKCSVISGMAGGHPTTVNGIQCVQQQQQQLAVHFVLQTGRVAAVWLGIYKKCSAVCVCTIY